MSRTFPRPSRGRLAIDVSKSGFTPAILTRPPLPFHLAFHWPFAARLFMRARWRNAFCAAATLPAWPRHALSATA
jgi:hypothetical protein